MRAELANATRRPRAIDKLLGNDEKVALKILRPGASEIEEIHARFIREITVAARLGGGDVTGHRRGFTPRQIDTRQGV